MAITALKSLGIEPDIIVSETEKRVPAGLFPVGPTDQLLPTPRAIDVIEYSIEEAHAVSRGLVGTEHILLGLLRADEGIAAQVLMNLGLRLDIVREVIQVTGPQSQVSENEATNEPSSEMLSYWRERRPRVATTEQPEAYPKCGNPHLIRILWNRVHFSGHGQDDLEAGRAILCYYSKVRKKPAWICFRCSPQWSAVPQLSIQVLEWRVAKEHAVAAEDYETAIKHREALRSLMQQLSQIVDELLTKDK
jgi:hypothetical protein